MVALSTRKPTDMKIARTTVALLLASLLAAAPRVVLALDDCPSIQRQADDSFRLPFTGSRDCDASACAGGVGSFVQDVVVGLCEALSIGGLGVSCAACDCCREPDESLFTGTDHTAVRNFSSPTSCGIGGRGQRLGEGALCLLRDLANEARDNSAPGRGIHLESNRIDLGIGDVFATQRIGLREFDPAGRRARGFHSLDINVPVLGSIGGLTQDFEARLTTAPTPDSPLFPLCGDFKLRDTWQLDLTADDLQHRMGFEVGPFYIPTPVGELTITPRFDYESNLQVVSSPLPPFPSPIKEIIDPGPICGKEVRYLDPASPTPFIIANLAVQQASVSAGTPAWGWRSIVALGGRAPDPTSASFWTPDGSPAPERPDFDFNQARNEEEKRPNSRFHAGVRVAFGIEALKRLLSFPPLSVTEAELFATSDLDAAFSTQFQLLAHEQVLAPSPFPDCDGASASGAVFARGAASAFAGFDIDAGLNLRFKLDLGLFVKRFGIFKRFDVVDLPGHVGPGRESARARVSSGTPTEGSVSPFSARDISYDAFIDECFFEPPPPVDAPPAPSFAPGNPTDLVRDLTFPCNVCVFLPTVISSACVPTDDTIENDDAVVCDPAVNGMPCETRSGCENRVVDPPVTLASPVQQKQLPASQDALPAELRWQCDAVEKLGCSDTCRWVPDAETPLQVVESAVDLVGAHCRDVPRDGALGAPSCTTVADCDDGNPCTSELCEASGRCVVLALDGGSCDNGAFCDGPDTCEAGTCVGTTNPCPGAACNEGTRSCQATSTARSVCDGLAAGDPCDDGTACTVDDRCADGAFGGVCRGTPALDCDDGDAATADSCEVVAGTPQCVNVDASVIGVCGDGARQPGEQCDGSDDSRCPGACNACRCPAAELCANGVDDDGDGLIDCADSGCPAAGCQCRPIARDPGSIRPGRLPGQDQLRLHGSIQLCEPIDPTTQEVNVRLSNATGTVYEGTIAPGAFRALGNGSFVFRDAAARSTRTGISKLLLNFQSQRTLYTFRLETFGDLGDAESNMLFEIRIGGQNWAHAGSWQPKRGGWKLALPGER